MSKHSTLVQWSENDQCYIAVVPELEGLSAFGNTPEEAVKELAKAKKLFLEVFEEDGEEIPEPDVLKPFSGQTRLRLPKTLHASLSREAKKEGLSLNTFIVQLLSEKNSLKQAVKVFLGEIVRLEEEIKLLRQAVSENKAKPEALPNSLPAHSREVTTAPWESFSTPSAPAKEANPSVATDWH